MTGSGSTTAFTVGVGGQVSVNVSAVFTGNSNGVSVLNLTGDGSGNTFVVSSLGGFPGVVTLNDTNRNQGPPPPVDTITLLAGVGANVNTYPDGNGGTDMHDGFGILDIVGSRPQDSTTIQDDTDVEEGGWRDSIYDTIVIPEAPMPGDPSSMSVEATAIPGYSGLNQTGDWTFLTEIGTPFYYADGSSFGLAQGFIYEGDGTATLSNGGALTYSTPSTFYNYDISSQAEVELSFVYFQPPSVPADGNLTIDASAPAREPERANPSVGCSRASLYNEGYSPVLQGLAAYQPQWAFFGQNTVTVSAVNPALHVSIAPDNALPANFSLFYNDYYPPEPSVYHTFPNGYVFPSSIEALSLPPYVSTPYEYFFTPPPETLVTIGTGNLSSIEGPVNIQDTALTVNESTSTTSGVLTLNATTITGWQQANNNGSLTFSGLYGTLAIQGGAADAFAVDSPPTSLDNTVLTNSGATTPQDVYVIADSDTSLRDRRFRGLCWRQFKLQRQCDRRRGCGCGDRTGVVRLHRSGHWQRGVGRVERHRAGQHE